MCSNLFERDGECYVGRELRWPDNLLDDQPPGAAHSGASHHASPPWPLGLRRLNSEEDLSEKLMGHVGPPTLLQPIIHGRHHKHPFWGKTPTSMMGQCIAWPLIKREECDFSIEISFWWRKTRILFGLVCSRMWQEGYQLLLVKERENT